MLAWNVSVTLRELSKSPVRKEQTTGVTSGSRGNLLSTLVHVYEWLVMIGDSATYIWAEGQEDATYWLAGRLIRRGTGQGTESVNPPYINQLRWWRPETQPGLCLPCWVWTILGLRLSRCVTVAPVAVWNKRHWAREAGWQPYIQSCSLYVGYVGRSQYRPGSCQCAEEGSCQCKGVVTGIWRITMTAAFGE